jgi:hypothetical protein
MAGPLTVSHRPWYWDRSTITADDLYYIATTQVSPGWKNTLLHALDVETDSLARGSSSLESRKTAFREDREIAQSIEQLLQELRPRRVLFTRAGDGSLVYLAAQKLRKLGCGECVTFAGHGEEFQAVRRLLLGLPVQIDGGDFLDAPVADDFDLVIFNGAPAPIQYAEFKHLGRARLERVFFTGTKPGSSLEHFLAKVR